MAPARPIHDIFAGLADPAGAASDPATALREGGHGDLPEGLVAEAIVSYAGTAPMEVAEHLAPFVTAHSPVTTADPGAAASGAADPGAAAVDVADGLALLLSAPVAAPIQPEPALVAGEEAGADTVAEAVAEAEGQTGGGSGGDFGAGELAATGVDPIDLDFGDGAGLAETGLTETVLAGTGLAETEPDVEMDLEPSFDAPVGLSPTGLSPTHPEPEPGEPEPTEPDPSQPGPTEPGPTEPDPGEETFGT